MGGTVNASLLQIQSPDLGILVLSWGPCQNHLLGSPEA